MTGFGRGSVRVGERHLRVEIRSVNHRGLDLKIRSREPDGYCESEIARAVRAVVERGALTVHVREEPTAGTGGLDPDRIKSIHGELERLRQELELDTPIDLATVGAFISVSPAAAQLAGEALWEALRPAVDAALQELREMRQREGEALAVDLNARLAALSGIVRSIEAGAAELPGRFARRLEERLASMKEQAGFDPGRMAQEVALMAERLDVSEELVRLQAHLDHLAQLTGGPAAAAVGRKLDFVIQEVGRELNTIGSKAQDAAIAALVIEGKVQLEKFREQAQNIE
jgi:uncharacterized protein (TIGR00255 family)